MDWAHQLSHHKLNCVPPNYFIERKKKKKKKKLFILNETMNMFTIVLFFVLSIHTLSKKLSKIYKNRKNKSNSCQNLGIKACSSITKNDLYENNSIF